MPLAGLYFIFILIFVPLILAIVFGIIILIKTFMRSKK